MSNIITECLSGNLNIGNQCYQLMKSLFPLCRSLTGQGVRDTLTILSNYLPNLTVHSMPSGTNVFDWTIPQEWNIKDAYVEDSSGEKVIDFKENNLHIVSYSTPIDKSMPLSELEKHLHSIPEQPNAIPYITSYYRPYWGFCLTHQKRSKLKSDIYRVKIDSTLHQGELNYGELIIPGSSTQEVLLSTYICHPSMANNELSGPVVTTMLAQWLCSLDTLKYTYRIIFVPETIGSIAYLSKHHKYLKENVIAGYNITCIGDERCYSFLPSRAGDSLADKAALHALHHIDAKFLKYSWLDRGSDERQFCSPGVDLPIASIMRSKYGTYPEYHTSLDNLDFVTPKGLQGGFQAIKSAIEVIERNSKIHTKILCEPQLGKRQLYPSLGAKETHNPTREILNVLSLADGRSLLEIADYLNLPFTAVLGHAQKLIENDLIEEV